MKLRELLQQLQEVQQKIEASPVWIVGGTPRDRYLNHLENIEDLDLTSGDKTIDYTSQEFYLALRKKYNITRKTMSDGHSSIFIGNFKMDFSSNFNVPGIDQILAKMGINNPTDMQREIYSRDFTCNALLLSLDLKNLTDPTHRGFKDIKAKIISTCLDPTITLTTNKNRVVRAIYLAAKLDFDLDPAIISFVQKNPESIKISTPKVMAEKLNEAFKRNPEKAAHLITTMKLWNYVPILEIMQPYYSKNVGTKVAYFQGTEEPKPGKQQYKPEKAIRVQPRFKEPFFRNYDLYDTPGEHSPGSGYTHINDFKSVKDFIEHKRKKMKDKYKADDSYINDQPKNTKARIQQLALIKQAIDFPIDEQITPIIGDSESYETPIRLGPNAPADFTISPGQVNLGDYQSYPASAQIGGLLDKYLGNDDLGGKSEADLDYGYDLDEEYLPGRFGDEEDQLQSLVDKYLMPAPNQGLYGLPDGVDLEDEDLSYPTNINPEFGTTDNERNMYEDKWNI